MRFRNYLGIALLILLAAGSQPAIGALWQWSKTATNNAGADPSINWSEGMSPSSVNDSARAMMARIAEQRDDLSGLLTTTGTSTAYAVTTNQGIQTPTPSNGQTIAITVNVTNGANPVLTVDAGTAYPIQTSPGVGVPNATLIAGSPYSMTFSTTTNAWMLRNFYGVSSVSVPLGTVIASTLATSPSSNFLIAAGQCISTTTYAAYWTAIGSPAPGSCGAGTFGIVDLRGRFIAGLDTPSGFSAANRLTSGVNGCGTAMTSNGAVCANGNESITLITANLPPYTPAGSVSASVAITSTTDLVGSGSAYSTSIPGGSTGVSATFSGSAQGGTSRATVNIPPTMGLTYLIRVL